MEGRCERHTFEAAENLCRTCGYEFCHDCLVYTYGTKRAPYCLQCAIAAAGIRSSAGHAPKATSREIKKELRARKKEGAPQAMAEGPVHMDWAVADDDHPAAEPVEPDLKKGRKHRLPGRKGRTKKAGPAVEPVDPFDSIPALPEELVAAADPERTLVDPSRPRQPEPEVATPAPMLPPANDGVAPLVIDELEPAPFDHLVEPVPAPQPASLADVPPPPSDATPTDAAGRPFATPAPPPQAPAPAAPPSVPDLPGATAPVGGAPQLVDPLAADDLFAGAGAPTGPGVAGAPQPVAGPPIVPEGGAPAPFPGPRADGLPQRTPGAQLPAGAVPPRPAAPPPPPAPPSPTVAAPPAPPAPAPPAPTPPAAPVAPAASTPTQRAPVEDLGPDKGKGFWRLMPSSMRQKRGQQDPAEPEQVPTFADLGPVGPPPPDRPLKTLAEMRPDEIDAALPDVTDLYGRVSDQNATTF